MSNASFLTTIVISIVKHRRFYQLTILFFIVCISQFWILHLPFPIDLMLICYPLIVVTTITQRGPYTHHTAYFHWNRLKSKVQLIFGHTMHTIPLNTRIHVFESMSVLVRSLWNCPLKMPHKIAYIASYLFIQYVNISYMYSIIGP